VNAEAGSCWRSARRAAAALLFALLAPAARAQCTDCHADRDFMASAMPDKSKPVDPLIVDKDRFARSVHGKMDCADCHQGYDETPHPTGGLTLSCASCHADEQAALASSVHGAAKSGEPRLPVKCQSCHGVHDVLRPSERDSRLHPLNVDKTCGQCHFSVDPATATVEQLLREPYTDDAHADGILRAGLTVAATCVSCHGGHTIHPKGDPASPVSRQNIDQTCGKCHVGVVEQYEQSIHAQKGGADHAGATCSDCHPPHAMTQADDDFRVQTIQACTKCHAERASSFRQTYHGKVSSLGFGGRVATCEACHSNHRILPASDPRSTVNPANIVSTCAQCHKTANAQFATYMVHADPTDAARSPGLHLVYVIMRALLVGTLVLGGVHVALWLNRAIAAGAWRRQHHGTQRWVRRWPFMYVVFHVWMMSAVLLLSSTGLPLHYSDKPWAQALMSVFGGPSAAGWVHRFAAMSLGVLVLVYLVHIGRRAFVNRERGLFTGPDTMLPRWKDVQDLWGNLRWFVFLAPQPKYDRWTYWEKFDFWAAFWGLFVIGASGLVLWFPERATTFLPGWSINVAVVIHGIEALLDIAFIFTVHAFHANLRPDKFPMDTMFLTGRIPEAEFAAERPLEYERARAAGTLEAMVDAAPTRRLRRAAYVLGACALGVGFFFVAMMLLALIGN
jgi:cytochrome b subunit of formate dehydrogenase